MTPEKEFEVRFVGSEPADPESANIDVIVTLPDGRQFVSTFWTPRSLERFFQAERTSSRSPWAAERSFAVLPDLAFWTVRAAIADMLKCGAFHVAFEPCATSAGNDADRAEEDSHPAPEPFRPYLSWPNDDIDLRRYLGAAHGLAPGDPRLTVLREQRDSRGGWDDSELWSLYENLLDYMLPRVKRFAEITKSHPADLTAEEWISQLHQFATDCQTILDRTGDAQTYKRFRAFLSTRFLDLWS